MTDGQPDTSKAGTSSQGRLLFPWDDTDGLTSALRDPALWATAFAMPRTRKFIKNAAKDVLNVRGVVHTDGEQIGELLVQLLSSRRGRSALLHEFKKLLSNSEAPESFLAQNLHRAVHKKGLEAPASLYKRQGVRYYLDPAAIEAAPESFGDWSAETILLVASPFAILQKRELKRLVSALQRNPAVKAYLEAEKVAASGVATPDVGTIETNQPRPSPQELKTPAPVAASRSAENAAYAVSADVRATPVVQAIGLVVEANARAKAALEAGDFERAMAESNSAKRLSTSARAAYAALRAREDVVAQELEVDIPNTAFATEQSALAWITELQQRLQKHEEHRKEFVRKRRESLAIEIRGVGLTPPEDLLVASTLEQVQTIREREQSSIRIERAWRRLVDSGDAVSFSELNSDVRAQLALRLIATERRGDVLQFFVSDEDVRASLALDRLMPVVREQLLAGHTLPVGFWRCLWRRVGAGLLGLLDANEVTQAIVESAELDVQAGELHSVLHQIEVPRTHALFLWALESWLAPLSIERRIALLVDIARVAKDAKPIRLLIELLTDHRRSGEALMLAALALRSNLMDATAFDATRPALLRAMLDSCSRRERHPILRDILASPDGLLRHEDGFIALLYVAAEVDPALLDTLLYSDPSTYDFVKSKYPALVEEWLYKIKGGYVSLEAVDSRERRILEVQHVFSEWKHELARKSSYTSWPPAQEYQRHIVAWLQSCLDAVASTRAMPVVVEPDDLIEQIRLEHELELAEGTARRNMDVYIRDQLDRLQTLVTFAAEQDANVNLYHLLGNPYVNLRARLDTEAQTSAGVVRDVFERALTELSR